MSRNGLEGPATDAGTTVECFLRAVGVARQDGSREKYAGEALGERKQGHVLTPRAVSGMGGISRHLFTSLTPKYASSGSLSGTFHGCHSPRK